jgi:hypothetical protein
MSHLAWACYAGLPDAVSHWLQRCPEAVDACINTLDADGHSAFSQDCISSVVLEVTPERRAGCHECAVLLCSRPSLSLNVQAGREGNRRTHAQWIKHAGLKESAAGATTLPWSTSASAPLDNCLLVPPPVPLFRPYAILLVTEAQAKTTGLWKIVQEIHVMPAGVVWSSTAWKGLKRRLDPLIKQANKDCEEKWAWVPGQKAQDVQASSKQEAPFMV